MATTGRRGWQEDRKRTVVFVTEVPPAPVHDGATARTAALLRILEAQYQLVGLVVGEENDIARVRAGFPGVRWEVLPRSPRVRRTGGKVSFLLDHYMLGNWSRTTWAPAIARRVRGLVEEQNAVGVVARFVEPACMIGRQNVPLLIDADVDHRERARTLSDGERGLRSVLGRWRNVVMMRRFDRALRRSDGAILVREEDVRRFATMTRTFWAPNCFDAPETRVRQAAVEPGVLRIGLLGNRTPANTEGVDWLCRQVIPGLREAGPFTRKIRFAFAGRICGHVPADLSPDGRGVTLEQWGVIDDTRTEFYDRIDVAMSPVFSGGGSSVKFFEALAAGVPVLATPFGARGYESEPNEAVFVCDDPEAWVARIERLASDDAELGRVLAGVPAVQRQLGTGYDAFRQGVLDASRAVFETGAIGQEGRAGPESQGPAAESHGVMQK